MTKHNNDDYDEKFLFASKLQNAELIERTSLFILRCKWPFYERDALW